MPVVVEHELPERKEIAEGLDERGGDVVCGPASQKDLLGSRRREEGVDAGVQRSQPHAPPSPHHLVCAPRAQHDVVLGADRGRVEVTQSDGARHRRHSGLADDPRVVTEEPREVCERAEGEDLYGLLGTEDHLGHLCDPVSVNAACVGRQREVARPVEQGALRNVFRRHAYPNRDVARPGERQQLGGDRCPRAGVVAARDEEPHVQLAGQESERYCREVIVKRSYVCVDDHWSASASASARVFAACTQSNCPEQQDHFPHSLLRLTKRRI